MLPAAMAAGKHLGYGDTLLNPLIERARFQPQNQGDYGDYVICACCRDVTHSNEGGKRKLRY
jgi:hypothetical protein